MNTSGKHLLLIAVLGYGAGACTRIVDPPLPAGAVPLVPPAVYQRWWRDAEACSGKSGSLANVSWFYVPGVSKITFNSAQVDSYWSLHSNQIVLASDAVYNGQAVRHEMLHALLPSTRGTHPRSYFLGACAGVVACVDSCIEGRASSDPTSVTVPADSLSISAEVRPVPAGAQVDGGVFTVVVKARNSSTYPVTVDLPRGRSAYPPSFAFDLREPGIGSLMSGTYAVDSSTLFFAPGETKQYLFDFVMGTALPNPPAGAYLVRGAFGTHWTQYVSFTLSP
jgi:hypothetical protein